MAHIRLFVRMVQLAPLHKVAPPFGVLLPWTESAINAAAKQVVGQWQNGCAAKYTSAFG